MKTISQLGSGKLSIGTTAYMQRAEQLMQCTSDVCSGISPNSYFSLLFKTQDIMYVRTLCISYLKSHKFIHIPFVYNLAYLKVKASCHTKPFVSSQNSRLLIRLKNCFLD